MNSEAEQKQPKTDNPKAKKYILEIILDKEGTAIHETTSEGVNLYEARLILAILEEYKNKMLSYIIFNQLQPGKNPNMGESN